MKKFEQGFVHILTLLILIAGLVIGLYLVQHPQIFKSRASEYKINKKIVSELEEKLGINKNGKLTTEKAKKIALINPSEYQQLIKQGLIENSTEVEKDKLVKSRLEQINSPSVPKRSSTQLTTSSISSCGDITSSGTYTLTQDLIGQTYCLSIHDTNNVNLDCQNHTITASPYAWYDSAILVTNVSNFSIKNCNLTTDNGKKALFIRDSNGGNIQYNNISTAFIEVQSSNNLKVFKNSFNKGTYSQLYSSNNQIVENTISDGAIYSQGKSSNNVIQKNIINGGWNGNPLGQLQGQDNGILLHDESATSVLDNNISNTWGCGIEVGGFTQYNQIKNNRITNSNLCAIGGFYWVSWLHNTINSNITDNVPYLLLIFRIYNLEPDQQYLYFKDNLFSKNTLIKQFAPNGELPSVYIDLQSSTTGIPSSSLRLENNLFINNDFNKTVASPQLIPPSMILDGGGNQCLPGGNPSTQPLDCNKSISYCTELQYLIRASFLKSCGETEYDSRGDLNKDHVINGADISYLVGIQSKPDSENVCLNLLNNPPSCYTCTACTADVNKNGYVNGADTSSIVPCWGKKATDIGSNGKSCSIYDIDGSEIIDDGDKNCIASQMLQSCPANLPSPTPTL